VDSSERLGRFQLRLPIFGPAAKIWERSLDNFSDFGECHCLLLAAQRLVGRLGGSGPNTMPPFIAFLARQHLLGIKLGNYSVSV
jgi:hypothetical protein